MQKYLAALSFAIITLFFISCSDNYDGQTDNIVNPPQASVEWTVLYYGAGNSSADLNGEISEVISAAQGMENVLAADLVKTVACLSSQATNGNCQIYDLKFRPYDSGNQISSAVLANWENADMSDAQTLRNFVEYGMTNFPAEKYLLLIGGVSDGWNGACLDEINGSGQMMSMVSMRQALETLVINGENARIDLLAWLSPQMGMVEVGYEFKDLADYMVAAPWKTQINSFETCSRWMLDVVTNPQMNAEQLGKMIVDGVYESALENNQTAQFSLLNLSGISEFSSSIRLLSDLLTDNVSTYYQEIFTAWDSTWISQTDDSSAVDIQEFARRILADPVLSQQTEIAGAAAQIVNIFDQTVIYTRTTVESEPRGGVMIYFPVDEAALQIEQYNTLKFSVENPSWQQFIVTLLNNVTATSVTISGTVSWPGNQLQNLYVFMNTARVGAPNILLNAPVNITQVISPSEARFEVTFNLDSSVETYFGVFQDRDNDHALSTGDRYGYYRPVSNQRDWITMNPGDSFENVVILLNTTR